MAMEITNNYRNYAANYADTAKKADSQAAAAKTSGKDKVQEYYEKLCKKFPQINFNTKGVLSSNSSKVTVNLSYDCLKKMANDSEFAKEIEWNLSGEMAANSMVYGWAQRDGVVLGGRTVTYDANGNRQSSCGGMRTANAGDSNTNKMQKKYKTEEERWLKARKKREEKEKTAKKQTEKKAEEKRMAGRRAEKKEAEEARTETGEYTVSATGTDIKRNTKNGNGTENIALEKTDGTEELSEAEEMEIFKKEFYEALSKITNHRTVSNAAVNISEAAFEAMKDDPQYREKILSLIQRDWGDSYAPRNCSVLITVGASLNEYRGDSWPVGYDSEFDVRSQNSFYKRTSDKKANQKELLEEYLEKRAQVKKQQQEMLNAKIAKQGQERSRLLQSWNNERLLSKASIAYEANVLTEAVTDMASLPG